MSVSTVMVMPVRGQVTTAAGPDRAGSSTKFWSKPPVGASSGAFRTSPSRVGRRRSQGVPATGRYDAGKGRQYLEQARTDLAEAGVTFPIQIYYHIKAGDQTAQDQATVLKNIFENLAEDYIQINIKTYITNVTSEVRSPALASFEISGWGADYRDPENFLNQLVTGNDSAIYTSLLTKANTITDPETKEIFAQFSQMVAQANAIVDDLDARYEAQAQAEAFYYEHALMIPCRGVSVWSMTKENTYSHPGGSRIYRNWETSSEPYTAEQYEQLKAAFEAELG